MGYACCLLERVVATVPHSTTAATGCIAAVWAWGWQLLLCLDAGYSFFFLEFCVTACWIQYLDLDPWRWDGGRRGPWHVM